MAAHSGPKIIKDDLNLNLDIRNIKSYNPNLIQQSQIFDNPYWTNNNTIFVSVTELAPDGSKTATTLEDNSTSAYRSISRSIPIFNNNQTYRLSIFVKKTLGENAPVFAVNTSLTGGTSIFSNQRLNTNTGVVTSATVIDFGAYWRMNWSITNNNTSNTSLNISIFPAARLASGGGDTVTAIGTATIWGAMITSGTDLIDYIPNFGDNSELVRNLNVNNQSFFLSNNSFYAFNNDTKSIRFTRNMPPDVAAGGHATFTASGDMAAANYLHNNHTTIVWFRPIDRNPTNYDSTQTQNAIAVYRGFHSMWFCTTTAISYSIWGRTGTTNNSYSLSFSDSTLGEWMQIAAVRNNGILSLYKNGILRNSGTITSGKDGIPTSNDIRIAIANNTGSDFSWQSNLDFGSLKMYKRALNIDEIQQNFVAVRGRFGLQ